VAKPVFPILRQKRQNMSKFVEGKSISYLYSISYSIHDDPRGVKSFFDFFLCRAAVTCWRDGSFRFIGNFTDAHNAVDRPFGGVDFGCVAHEENSSSFTVAILADIPPRRKLDLELLRPVCAQRG
jgi:hypothetical protein